MWKSENCPNCGGRSFSPYGDSDEYFECLLCERPTEKFHKWYQEKHPEVYCKFMELPSEKHTKALLEFMKLVNI